jgi:hypothetical protein
MVRQDALDAATAEHDREPDKHTFAEFLNALATTFEELKGENLGTTTGQKGYERVFSMIDGKLKKVREEISKPEVVDLNELIETIVTARKRIPMKTHIQFVTYLRKVPLIIRFAPRRKRSYFKRSKIYPEKRRRIWIDQD